MSSYFNPSFFTCDLIKGITTLADVSDVSQRPAFFTCDLIKGITTLARGGHSLRPATIFYL